MEYIGWIDGTTYDTATTPQSTFRLRAGPCSAVQQRAGTEQEGDCMGPADTAKNSKEQQSQEQQAQVQGCSRPVQHIRAAGRALGPDRCPCRWSRWPWSLRPHAAGTPSPAAGCWPSSPPPAALLPATLRRERGAKIALPCSQFVTTFVYGLLTCRGSEHDS